MTAMQDLKEDLELAIDSANDALNDIIDETTRSRCKAVVRITIGDILKRINNELLETEKQDKKNECIEFSKYIRNGKDHFNNGYSTEMVYDEWIEKSKLQRE